jgi:HEAT repeat protein
MKTMAKIYVSSTFKDLEECRENVRRVLRQMKHEDVAMEYYVAEDRRPVDKCLEDVAACDLYIGIFAWRYGYIPPGYDKSITELEYRKAVETNKKCHIFLLNEDVPWLRKFIDKNAQKIDDLREELSENYTVSFFKTPEELGSLVSTSVHNWERELGIESIKKGSIAEIDIESYTKAIELRYKTLDLNTLTPSQKEDYLRVLLSNVFVEQNVREKTPPLELPKEVLSKIKEVGDIDTEFVPKGLTIDDIKQANISYYSKTPVPVLDVITDNKNKYLVILGDPGSGKSILARYILLSILNIHQDAKLNERFNGYLPLLIELREFIGFCSENKCKTFLDNFHYLGETQGYHLTREGIHEYLKENENALVIFDGLDEIFNPKEWEKVNHMIAGFAIDYPKVRIIVTSRIVGYKPNILSDAGFYHFTIQEFEEEQIKDFLDKWYSIALYDNQEDIREKKERIIKSLEESPSIRQIAGNPLLLTILAIIGKHQELPQERWKLYDHAASVLVEHWDINRHLKDHKVDVEFIGEEDKKQLLRRIAYNMQSAPEGLSGNLIHKEVLRNEIEEYFKDRYKTEPERATIIARSMIDQFRRRNFILCLYGADFFGFIHRTFLEYFCASAIVEKYNDQEIDINNLKNDYFEKYWEDETWHEVLRLICGMKEKLAGELIQHIIDVYHPRWFGKRPPWNIVLAIKCFSEMRNPTAFDETSKILLLRVIELFEMIRWTKDIEEFLIEQIVPATKLVGTNWPHRNIITENFIRSYVYSGQYTWEEINSNLTIAWADFIAGLGSNSKEIYQAIEKKLTGSNYSRYLAILVLGKYQPKNINIIKILINSARHDYFYLIRRASVQAIAQGWHDDPETLPLLKDRAVNDQNNYVRRASVKAIAQGWHDDPETLPLLKDRAVNDQDNLVRHASVQAIAQGWHDDPETLPLLKNRAVNDQDIFVRYASVQAIAQGWHDDPETLPLLKNRAVNDQDNGVRRASVQAIAQGWHDDPETLPLLKNWAVNDQNNDVRYASVQAIAQGWHDDPETLPLLKNWAVNDQNNDGGYASVQAIAQGWHDDPETLPLLKNWAVNDRNNDGRYASVQAIAQGWHDDPETLPLLKNWAVNDQDIFVRYASVQAIAQGWHDDPETLPLLKDWVVNDQNNDVRYASVQAIAQGWQDDPETLPLLKDWVVNDQNNDIRYASVQAIAQGWHDDPETLPLLKDRAVNDQNNDGRYASVEAIAQGWHDDPETLPLLKDRAVNDQNIFVRHASVQAIVQGWHDDPETLPLLKNWAVNDQNNDVRYASVQAIAQGWHDDPETLPLLKNWAVNDQNNDVRRASVEAIAQEWHDDPETLPLLKDRAVNDQNDDVRRASVKAIAQGWHDDPETLPLLKDKGS